MTVRGDEVKFSIAHTRELKDWLLQELTAVTQQVGGKVQPYVHTTGVRVCVRERRLGTAATQANPAL